MPAFPSKSKPKKPMRVRKNDALPEVPVPDLRPEDVPPPPEREWREEFERKIRGDQT